MPLALKRRANLTNPLRGEQVMPFDSNGLQFAHSSHNLPKHEDFNAAFLTAQEISWSENKSGNNVLVSRNPDSSTLRAAPLTSHFKEANKEVKIWVQFSVNESHKRSRKSSPALNAAR
jgi:hypothetical protein